MCLVMPGLEGKMFCTAADFDTVATAQTVSKWKLDPIIDEPASGPWDAYRE
jgi:hypothetical protein